MCYKGQRWAASEVKKRFKSEDAVKRRGGRKTVKLGSRHRRHFRPPPSFLSATTRLNAQPGTPSPTRNHRWTKRTKRCLAVNLHAWRSPVIYIQYHHSRITLIRQDHPRESRARHNRSFLLSKSSNSMDLSFSFPRKFRPAPITGCRCTDLF
jgi:hypothetical protein